jgi:CheY-like chemotaxis protein/Tfp pilus assembly protein PilZ
MTTQKKAVSRHNLDRKSQFVLIVDDDAHSLSCLSILLKRFGCQVLKAATGKVTLATAMRLVPSLIMISPGLPDINGFEVMRQLKANFNTSHIPLIGLIKDDSQKDRCTELGAAGFLCRPLDAEALFRAVQEAMEKNPRTHMRVRAVLPVKVHNSPHEGLYGAYTIALSTGGMFLRTMNPVSVNSELSVEFDLNGRAVIAESKVIYNCQAGCGPDREKGVGLQFVDISPGDQNAIREFVRNEIMNGLVSIGAACD